MTPKVLTPQTLTQKASMLPAFAVEAKNPLTEAERFDWLRLSRSDNVGPRTFSALLSRYGSAAAALEALPGLIASGKPIRIATIAEVDQELEELRRSGAVLLGVYEPDYPALLRQINTAPPLITVRGDLSSLRRSKVAIVGSRNASAAGLAFTEQISRGIARAGHVIVSGLARGIDARAHQAALETGTIAVLAGRIRQYLSGQSRGFAGAPAGAWRRDQRNAFCLGGARPRLSATQPHCRRALARNRSR